MIEKYIISNFVNCLQLEVEYDKRLTQLIQKNTNTYSLLENWKINPKYIGGAPWNNAQLQLGKISKFKTPYEKYVCISRAWRSILESATLLDTPEPDTFLTIMSYVIFKAEIPNLIANIHFIMLFADLDDRENSQLFQFRAALEDCRTNVLGEPKRTQREEDELKKN